MKTTILLLFVIPAFLTFQDISKDIATAIRTGNAKKLSNHFSTNIDLSVLDKEDVYSKAQAEMIIKDFFAKHPPKTFTIVHQGTSKTGMQYGIGNLITEKGLFRVSFYIKQKEEKQYIQQLRIDVEE